MDTHEPSAQSNTHVTCTSQLRGLLRNFQVHAVCVCNNSQYFYAEIQKYLDGLGLALQSRDIIDIVDGYQGVFARAWTPESARRLSDGPSVALNALLAATVTPAGLGVLDARTPAVCSHDSPSRSTFLAPFGPPDVWAQCGGPSAGGTARQAMHGLWTEVCGQQKQSNDPSNNQHILNTSIIGRC